MHGHKRQAPHKARNPINHTLRLSSPFQKLLFVPCDQFDLFLYVALRPDSQTNVTLERLACKMRYSSLSG